MPLGMFKSVALLREQHSFLRGRVLNGPPGEVELPELSGRLFNEKKTMLFSGILPRIYKQAGRSQAVHTPIFHRWADVKDTKTSVHTEGLQREGKNSPHVMF